MLLLVAHQLVYIEKLCTDVIFIALEFETNSLNVLNILLTYYSIEFDRDCDFFAIAGVTKKIKVKI